MELVRDVQNQKYQHVESVCQSHLDFDFSPVHGNPATFPAKDLANQIKHWDVYAAEMENQGRSHGVFLNPLAAEWFSGQMLSFVVCFKSKKIK